MLLRLFSHEEVLLHGHLFRQKVVLGLAPLHIWLHYQLLRLENAQKVANLSTATHFFSSQNFFSFWEIRCLFDWLVAEGVLGWLFLRPQRTIYVASLWIFQWFGLLLLLRDRVLVFMWYWVYETVCTTYNNFVPVIRLLVALGKAWGLVVLLEARLGSLRGRIRDWEFEVARSPRVKILIQILLADQGVDTVSSKPFTLLIYGFENLI